ncbi:hypothetical protein HK096_005658 [Nowakowskiella sp. JEL0078]|nr:hypothetical protein HK096_005658 [Nowakowskiella sp. JEL0078]
MDFEPKKESGNRNLFADETSISEESHNENGSFDPKIVLSDNVTKSKSTGRLQQLAYKRKMTHQRKMNDQIDSQHESDSSDFDWLENSDSDANDSDDGVLKGVKDEKFKKNFHLPKWLKNFLWRIFLVVLLAGPGIYEKLRQDKVLKQIMLSNMDLL